MDDNKVRGAAETEAVSPRRAAGRGGLARTLLLVFLPLIIGLLILAGMAGAFAAVQVAETRAVEQLDLVATLKERDVNNWLVERDRDLAVLAGDRAIRQDIPRLLDAGAGEAQRRSAYSALGIRLKDFLDRKVPFSELFLLDAETGVVIVSTNVLQEGFFHDNEDYFQEGIKGAYVQPLQYDPQTDVPSIVIARPVFDENGEPVAALVGRVTMGDLTVLMALRVGLGDTGETYLVNRDYLAVTGLRFGQPGQRVDTEGTGRAVEQYQRGSSQYANYQNTAVYGNHRWVPGLQVALLAEMSEAEVLASRQSVLLAVGGLLVIGGLLAAGVVLYVSRRITRPITELTDAAIEMAAGDLTQRVVVDRQDEIGALSQAFDEMADQLQDSIGTLEERVAERTQELERRAVQIETASDVGRVAASILELEVLTRRVVDLVQSRFDLYYVGLFLIDDASQQAVLEAGTGEAGSVMKEADHKLEVGGASMVGTACDLGEARIALDVGEESVRFDNPLLPETRSEMALPMMVGDRVLGAIDVQSRKPSAYSEEDIAVLQLVANQVAVAVDNARKFSEEAGILEATSPLYRVSRRLATAVTLDEIAQAIISSVAETEADGCSVGRLERGASGKVESTTFIGSWDRQGASGFPIGVPFAASEAPFPLEMVMTFWTIDDITKATQMPEAPREFLTRFQGQAFVNVPLLTGTQVTGFVSIYRTSAGAFSPVSIRLYETLVDQAAMALERARLLEEAQGRAARDRLISEATTRMRETLDVKAVLESAADELWEALGLDKVVIRLAAGEDGK